MEVFWDQGKPFEDHEAFRRWQADHRKGYVLNIRPGQLPMLHRSLCPHVENHSRASLTDKPKLCSTDGEELKEYARREWNAFVRCSNARCFGG